MIALRARRRSESGFTLLEIMVALGIFAVAIASIMSLLLVAASSHKSAVDYTRAAMLAETVAADLEGQLRLGKPLRPVKDAAHASFPRMRYDLELHPVDDYCAEAVIVIRWKREGKDREQRFGTVLLGRVDNSPSK